MSALEPGCISTKRARARPATQLTLFTFDTFNQVIVAYVDYRSSVSCRGKGNWENRTRTVKFQRSSPLKKFCIGFSHDLAVVYNAAHMCRET